MIRSTELGCEVVAQLTAHHDLVARGAFVGRLFVLIHRCTSLQRPRVRPPHPEALLTRVKNARLDNEFAGSKENVLDQTAKVRLLYRLWARGGT